MDRMKKSGPFVVMIALGTLLTAGGCSDDGERREFGSAWAGWMSVGEAAALLGGGFRVTGGAAKDPNAWAEWRLGSGVADAWQAKSAHGPWLTVRRLDAVAGTGRIEDGAVAYDSAEGGVDVRVFATEGGVEDLWRFHEPRTAWGYDVALPEGYRLHKVEQVPGLVEVQDERGVARMRVHANAAWDASGNDVQVEVDVRGSRMTVRVEQVSAWPVVVDPEWTDTGAMFCARSGATLTNLPNGRVLVAGGDAPMTGTAELFDPATGTFTITGTMASPRREHAAYLLKDGRVVLVGGVDATDEGVADVEIYDPATGEFEVRGSVTVGSSTSTSMLPSGRLLVVNNNADSEIYDPATGLSSPGSPPPAAWLTRGTLLHSGKVLFTSADTTQLYDEQLDAFSWGPGLATKRSQHSITELADGRVLTAGGGSGDGLLSSTEIIDVQAGASVGPTLFAFRAKHSSILLSDGRVLLAGGAGSGRKVLASTELVDLVSSTSSEGPPFRSAVDTNPVVLLPDGHVLGAGTDQTASKIEPRVWSNREGNTRFAVPRYNHTATRLDSGDVVFIGIGSTIEIDPRVEIFEASTRRLRVIGSLNHSRTAHSATLLKSGRILIVGGTGDDVANWELFDPAEGATVAEGSLDQDRIWHTATLMSDGRVLIAGGRDTRSLAVWDPNTLETEEVGSLLETSREHTATLLPDGRVLVTGGKGVGPDYPFLSTTEWIDTTTWEVTKGPDMHFKRAGHLAAYVAEENRVVVAGFQSAIEELDLTNPTWEVVTDAPQPPWASSLTPLPSGGLFQAGGFWGGAQNATALVWTYHPQDKVCTVPGCAGPLDVNCLDAVRWMSTPRGSHTATLISDHEVLLAGGGDRGNYQGTEYTTLELYDTEKETFSGLEPFVRPQGSVTLLPTGKLLLAGGMGEAGDESDMWDPAVERSAKSSPMTTPRTGHTATMLDSGKVLLLGGVGNMHRQKSAEVFDPASETFQATGTMQVGRSGHTATRLPSGEILIVGGTDDPTCELFDPVTETFRATGALHEPRSKHAAVLTAGGRVVVAGGESPDDQPVTSIESYDPNTGSFEPLSVKAAVGGRTLGAMDAAGRLVFASNGVGYTLDPSLSSVQGLGGAPTVPAAMVTMATGGIAICGDGAGLTEGRLSCARVVPGTDVATPMFDKESTEGSAVTRLLSGELWVNSVEAGGPLIDIFSQTDTAASKPEVTSVSDRIRIGETVELKGAGFASHPAFAIQVYMPGIVPAVTLLPANGGPAVPCNVEAWTDTTLSFSAAPTAFHGPVWLHVLVHGVPSEAKLVVLEPLAGATACTFDAACGSGHCVEGVCCDTACDGGCESCLAERKGKGEDGTCGVVPQGTDPKDACEETPSATCRTTGVCDGSGACEPTPDGTPCADSRLCLAGECMPTLGEPCETSLQCATDQVCGPNGTCQQQIPAQAMVDPGGGCSCRTTPRPTTAAWLLSTAIGLLGGAARRRRTHPHRGRKSELPRR